MRHILKHALAGHSRIDDAERELATLANAFPSGAGAFDHARLLPEPGRDDEAHTPRAPSRHPLV